MRNLGSWDERHGVAQTATRSSRERHVREQYEGDISSADYAASYAGWRPGARYFQSRLLAVLESLRRSPGGDLLDIGCGPGMLLSRVVDERPGDFRINALDMSPGMIRAAAGNLRDADDVRLMVGRAESLPLRDDSLDVVVATGVLEYCRAPVALQEIARVTRPGGLVLVSILNPLSHYRLFEWGVYWQVSRLLGIAKRLLTRPSDGWPGVSRSGIRAIRESRLRRMMQKRGLRTDDVVYYDLNLLVPPVDQVVRRWTRRWRQKPETTIARGRRRWMGTAYLVTARRERGLDGDTASDTDGSAC